MKAVLITGATSGIGKELAYKFAKDKNSLVLVARRLDILEEIKEDIEGKFKVKVKILEKDLKEKSSAKEVYEYTQKENIKVETLINNAGFGDYGEFTKSDLEKQIDMINLNIASLVSLTHYYLKDMQENNYGNVLNVASVAAFMPGAYMSVYYATKAFVLSFTEALSEEVKDFNIHIAALCPGPTKTDFENKASVSFSSVKMQTAEEVINYAYEKFLARKSVIIIPGFNNRGYIRILNFLPRSTVRKIIAIIQRKFRR